MSKPSIEERALLKYEKELEREILRWGKIVFSDALTKYAKHLGELYELSQSFDARTASSVEYKKFLARFEWLEKAVDVYRQQALNHQKQSELAGKHWTQAKFDLEALRFKLGQLRYERKVRYERKESNE